MQQVAAHVAKVMMERSEDPWTKVGAVALTTDNRIIATAYNGLLPAYDMTRLWEYHGGKMDRDVRLPFMVHAEQNLCSLIKRGEAHWVVITTMPCPSCALLLAAHGIRKIVYLQPYERDDGARRIAEFYNLELEQYAENSQP